MRYLSDNMVPRSVTRLLKKRGRSAIEVRQALSSDARDGIITAYAEEQRRVLITHDSLMAARCLRARVPHVWLRMRESEDADSLDAELEAVEAAFALGEIRVTLIRRRR